MSIVNKIRITAIEAIPLRIKLKGQLKTSSGTYTSLTPVIVKMHTNVGITGVTEIQSSSTYERIGNEPYSAVLQILEEAFAPILIGANPFEVEVIWRELDKLQGLHWIKAGIDGAFYDIQGKALETTAARVIGGPCRTSVPIEGYPAYGIGMYEPEKVAALALQAKKEGFVELELKLGDSNPRLDIERVKLTREAIGGEMSIKADFNKAGETSTVIATIREMEKYGLNWVEQPVDEWDVAGMARIRQSISTPLIIDESVNTPQTMYIACVAGACDAVHLKPTTKGGLTGARRIAAVAEAAGIAVIPGTQQPTGIGLGIVHTFTSACRNIARGIHGSPLAHLDDDIVLNPVPQGTAFVQFSQEPGLGYELDENKVEKYRIR